MTVPLRADDFQSKSSKYKSCYQWPLLVALSLAFPNSKITVLVQSDLEELNSQYEFRKTIATKKHIQLYCLDKMFRKNVDLMDHLALY